MSILTQAFLAATILAAQPAAVAFGGGANLPVPVLTKSGTCPGAMNLTVTGATPVRPVAIFYGIPGSYTNPNPPCIGLVLNIMGIPGTTPRLATVQISNNVGTLSVNFFAPAGLCGRTFQAVDVFTCTTSNTIVL